jgi:DNA-binding ferritin-like protein
MNDIVKKEELKSRIMNIARENVTLPEEEVLPMNPEMSGDIELSFDKVESDDLKPCIEIVSGILHSMVQAQIFHWQTVGVSSYAAHKALQEYYEGIQDVVDKLVESYQGKYGIMTKYNNKPYTDFASVEQVISYFEELDSIIESNRTSLKDSYIQNQIDMFNELINSTLYKLKNLK